LAVGAALALAGCGDRSPRSQGESSMANKPGSTGHAHTNRLADETSPYLLQHAHNPVDWYPWGDEAFEKARREDKPVFLSIGYAACHWCHVMERECFENDSLAGLLNEQFVSIKVDREERPDLDAIYMKSVQMLTGGGGWPMSVFLTPDGRPFFGGTYFPPARRGGMPGFGDVLVAISEEYKKNKETIVEQAGRVHAALGEREEFAAAERLSWAPIDSARAYYRSTFDVREGGFGRAPKFPPAMGIRLLLREHARTGDRDLLDMATLTLDKMARGGIYDHLGGGFHRYSTDAIWLAPHFEKMLYDNALLAMAYLDAFLVTGNEEYARIVRETLDYEIRDMRDSGGAFHATEDADSEGEEGKFYVWDAEEVERLLGAERARIFEAYYDVTAQGNWEEKTILRVRQPLEGIARDLGVGEPDARRAIEEGRRILLEARAKRVRPGLDDKVLVAWNGLLISSLARAGAVLDEPRYTEAAVAAARFIREKMAAPGGRLFRTYRAGKTKGAAFLEDYAFLGNAYVDLYETTFDVEHVREAVRLADVILADFADSTADSTGGGFFFTPASHESLIVRLKDPYDSATPSGNSVAVRLLLRLARLCDREDYRQAAEGALRLYTDLATRAPGAFPEMLIVLSEHLSPSREIAIVGARGADDTRALLRAVHARFLPGAALAFREASASKGSDIEKVIPLLEGKTALEGRATAYVCRNHACRAPVTDVAALEAELR
jgi:uncharacterized protein YyaL (SSP411 family)